MAKAPRSGRVGSLQATRFYVTRRLDYCIESTGTYHMPVLQAFEGRPSVVNPMLAGATHRKTDVLDARMLAKQSMTNTWPRSFMPNAQGQILRVLWNQRREAARAATRNFNRINNIVLRFGHTFGAMMPCRSQEGLAMLDLLISGQATNHPGCKPEELPPEMRPVLQKLVADGEAAIAATKEAARKAKAFVEARTWPTEEGELAGADLLEILQTVPGVGPGTATVWLAEVVDPRRFQNSKQVAAYAGCDPSLKVSAGKVTEHVRRKGNLKLHEALLQCATAVVARGTTPLAKWAQQIAAKSSKGGFRKARGAVARRIACALWHVHRKGEPFTYDGYNFHRETATIAPVEQGLMKDGTTFVLPRVPKTMEEKKNNDSNGENQRCNSRSPQNVSSPEKPTANRSLVAEASAAESGLLLSGTVVARRRRTIASKKPGESDRFVIQLAVAGSGGMRIAEMWSDMRLPIGVPELGDQVSIPVEVRCYVQGGMARHTLVFGGAEKGEAF